MKKNYGRLIRRGITHSLGRYLSILAIVALGVGFIAGLVSTTPDMELTVDRYYDDNDVYDVDLKSTLGFTDEDAAAVAALPGALCVLPAYVTDQVTEGAGGVTRFIAADTQQDGINRTVLLEGRCPSASGECAVCIPSGYSAGCAVGDVLTISPENDRYGETLTPTEFTVVGIVRDPVYLSVESEPSTAGSGRVGLIAYILTQDVALPAYTDLFLLAAGAASENCFDDAYTERVRVLTDSVEGICEARAAARRDELLSDAEREYAEAEAEYLSSRADAQGELADARKALDDGKRELEDGRREYADSRAETDAELADARKTLDDGWTELENGWREYESSRAQADAELADARKALDDGKRELENGRVEYEQARTEAAAKLDDVRQTLDVNWREYYDGLRQYEESARGAEEQLAAAGTQLADGRAQLDGLWAQYRLVYAGMLSSGMPESMVQAALAGQQSQLFLQEAALSAAAADFETAREASGRELESARATLDEAREKLDAGERDYLAGKAEAEEELSAAEKTLADSEDELASGEQEYTEAAREAEERLAEAAQKLDDAERELVRGENDYKAAFSDAEAQFADAAAELADAERELRDGEEKYLSAETEAEEQFAEAESELADAREKIDSIGEGKWYVLDRESNVGYVSYGSNTEKIDAIARVFPVFFFLVAALVALTTMTRMVEEERTQIGALKSLGYSNTRILSYYLIYSGSAALLGSAIGSVLGMAVLPATISQAYGMMYSIPRTLTPFHLRYALLFAPMILVAILLAAFFSVRDELRDSPAALLRPKAPKLGKRIFIERITPLWRHMRFLHKVTARNLLRYKKRFFMTVIGVAGCSALLVTGFGLRDSIGDIVAKQYGELYRYDLQLRLDADALAQGGELSAMLADPAATDAYCVLYTADADVRRTENDETVAVTLTVPTDPAAFRELMTLRTRREHTDIPFDGGSVVLTEKLCETLGLSVGDSFALTAGDGGQALTFTLDAITENYVTSYAYIGREAYTAALRAAGESEDGEENTLLLRLAPGADGEQLQQRALAAGGVRASSLSSAVEESFSRSISKINYIVAVLILCAGMLSFIVIYNLTNINICERRRELATIRVLGFFDGEVAAYIYRETMLLSIIGTLAGLVGGIWLHSFVIRTAEVDAVMFGRAISALSFLWAFLISLAFALLTNLFLYPKLRRIDMVESLKVAD